MSVAALSPREKAPVRDAQQALDVLIFARDEAGVLPGTLSSLIRQIGPLDRLTVVADHCRDSTVAMALRSGARVLIRQTGIPGKGHALRWWLEQTMPTSHPDDRIVILDADSVAGPGLLDVMRRRIGKEMPAVQAVLETAASEIGTAGRLAALSETMDQRVFDALRSRLGWPVRLRGTGMGFQRNVLERCARSLGTAAEDAELSILLAASGVPIHAAWQAKVVDAKPGDDEAAMRQRARWVKGQMDLVRKHPRQLLALLGQGPRGWSLLSSVLGKPRSLTVPARAGAILLLAWAGPGLGKVGDVCQVILVLSLLVDAAALAAAVSLSPDPGSALRALFRLPAFLLVWIRSLILAARSRDGWLRARPHPHDAGVTSPGPASP